MRTVKRDPGFDHDAPRRGRRSIVLDDDARPAPRRTAAKKRSASRRDSSTSGWSMLPSINLSSPALVGSLGFILLATLTGLIQGGHLGFGAPQAVAATADSPWMPVQTVTISGQYHTRKADMYDAMNIREGASMFDADPMALRMRLEAMDWIDTASVARDWPSSLRVVVVEKEPYAFWQTKGVFWLIDRRGRTITKDNVAEFSGLPVVVGDGAPVRAAELIELLLKFPVVQRQVKASVRVGDRRWDLHLKTGVVVRLPEDGVEEALHRLTVLEQEQKIFERDIETIDLRLPDRMVIKPRGGAEESIARGEST